MLQTRHIFLIFIPFLTIFYDCKSGSTPNTEIRITDTIDIAVVEEPKFNKTEEYLWSIGLVKITDSLPEIIVDLKYASSDNFLGFPFYGELKNAFVQYECFQKLRDSYNILQKQKPGFTFIVYDAVRSIQSQQLMWDSIKVEPAKKHWYVANPARGSIHNYGMALDISIVDNDGNVLDMGTPFDYFGELAYPAKTDYFYSIGKLSKEQYENRKLLMSVMQQANFYVSTTEWWHYNASSLDYAKSTFKIYTYPSNTEN